jgi:hypothetical protein
MRRGRRTGCVEHRPIADARTPTRISRCCPAHPRCSQSLCPPLLRHVLPNQLRVARGVDEARLQAGGALERRRRLLQPCLRVPHCPEVDARLGVALFNRVGAGRVCQLGGACLSVGRGVGRGDR